MAEWHCFKKEDMNRRRGGAEVRREDLTERDRATRILLVMLNTMSSEWKVLLLQALSASSDLRVSCACLLNSAR